MYNWVVTLVSGISGALIGTYGGSFFLHKWKEGKIIKLRRIATKALKIFQKYCGKPYSEAESEFNTLTVSEKRIVLVALHKLGVPIGLQLRECFDINRVRLLDRIIDEKEINGMIKQIEQGNCDNLFFMDVDSFFMSNFRIMTMRNSAKKYVANVLSQSSIDLNEKKMNPPDNWISYFSFGEYKTIQAFIEQVRDVYFFNEKGNPDEKKINSLLTDIDLGLWDLYLSWSFEAYQNIKLQNIMTQQISDQLANAAKQPIVPITIDNLK